MNHEIAAALNAFNFRELFIEILGWDKAASSHTLHIGEAEYSLRAVAQKWSFTAFVCETDELPDSQTLAKIAREAGKITPELLVIFQDKNQSGQIWQWARRAPGKPVALRHQRVLAGRDNPLLIEKIEAISVSLDDEAAARKEGRDTVFAISQTVRAAFDVEKVTKKFYERFSKEHAAFLGFIKGIPDDEMQSWYASVMLNRLMFIYFVQHKGFLYFDGNEDKEYLLNQLKRAKKEKRPFYQGFLRPLFEKAFATPQPRSEDDNKLFGRVPYLNGGLFTKHKIEEEHDSIQIPDSAFEKIFDFFDDYDWHLDDNPLRKGREINPDVLGYIFEKYINQKQMGAYYTKEDITGYIARNTILPFWLERAREQLPQAFEGENSVWKLLQENPDKYIYPAVRHGLRDAEGVLRELPEHIARGVNEVSQRGDWNKPAPNDWGLPTEIWREVVARRQKYIATYDQCRGMACHAQNVAPPQNQNTQNQNIQNQNVDEGVTQLGMASHAPTGVAGVSSVDDLITLNLDIVQFCEDVVSLWADESLLRALWKTLAGNQNRERKSNEEASNGISILDPTCGSGAFLFAAINILEPLYSACLDRMTGFAREAEDKKLAHKNADFREILARVDDTSHHPNREYFVLKSILVNNLFGVDIMEEAVEICKLRLFLKLASCVEPNAEDENFGIEPLPDIDFNIRAGNTLVGYATEKEVKLAVAPGKTQTGSLAFDDTFSNIETQAQDIERAFDLFRQCQTENRDAELPDAKRVLRERLDALRKQLDAALAEQYEIGLSAKPKAFAAWRDSHQPFHWFIEFYGLLKRGGFDCIIGNPPWVEYSKVSNKYKIKEFATERCNNLWAFVVEKSLNLSRMNGSTGLIVPMSLVCTERMKPMQEIIKQSGVSWLSSFESDSNPGQLFVGVKQNVSILLHRIDDTNKKFTTRQYRFFSEARDGAFFGIDYIADVPSYVGFGFSKSSQEIESEILKKLFSHKPLSLLSDKSGKPIYVHRIAHYYIKAFNFVPFFKSKRDGEKKSEDYKAYTFSSPIEQYAALINSSTFYFYWQTFFDSFKAGKQCIEGFPFNSISNEDDRKRLTDLGKRLMLDMKKNSKRLKAEYATTGAVEYDQFYPRLSKPIIDEIDRVLASHYGFTDEELDFIINYDIKYRMGKTDNAE